MAFMCLGYLCVPSVVMFVSPCSFPTLERPLYLVVGGTGEDACRDAAHKGQVSCEQKAKRKVMRRRRWYPDDPGRPGSGRRQMNTIRAIHRDFD